MPSPVAVFTSAPSFKSARTASLLPCIAASTTDAAGEAACISAASARAPMAPTEMMSRRIRLALTLRIGRRGGRRRVVEIEFAGAVAELLEIGAPQHVEHREHGVGHWRAIG